MTDATKQKAKAKIESLKVGVGYPETWRDYSALVVKPDDALGNHLRAVEQEYRHQKAKLGQSVDRADRAVVGRRVRLRIEERCLEDGRRPEAGRAVQRLRAAARAAHQRPAD